VAGHPNSFGARSILATDEGPLTCYGIKTAFWSPPGISKNGFVGAGRQIGRRGPVYAGKGPASGFHGRAGDCGSGSHAGCGPAALRELLENQPADTRRARDRPFGSGGCLRVFGGRLPEHGIRLPSKFRKIRIPVLGAKKLSEFQCGATGHRHLPSGQSGDLARGVCVGDSPLGPAASRPMPSCWEGLIIC